VNNKRRRLMAVERLAERVAKEVHRADAGAETVFVL
jgi:hypothetical protein